MEKKSSKLKVLDIDGKKYYFNPFIFQVMIILLMIIVIVSGFLYGFSAQKTFYVNCDKKLNFTCENPLYNNLYYCGKTIPSNDYICKTELLPSGFEYGQAPPKIYDIFGLITILFFAIALIKNHYSYNMGGE